MGGNGADSYLRCSSNHKDFRPGCEKRPRQSGGGLKSGSPGPQGARFYCVRDGRFVNVLPPILSPRTQKPLVICLSGPGKSPLRRPGAFWDLSGLIETLAALNLTLKRLFFPVQQVTNSNPPAPPEEALNSCLARDYLIIIVPFTQLVLRRRSIRRQNCLAYFFTP
ncbi:MAG: hypothetical protein AMJ79_14705 [Phycisphaerae bacterium SM23_30]|nr:MAG: hypothetical protein AMJ79_14705 [Phycisphaerae bacterium SM23_30]